MAVAFQKTIPILYASGRCENLDTKSNRGSEDRLVTITP